MPEREWGWTEAGRESAKRNDVSPAEVIDALYSPLQYDNEFGDLLFVCGRADTGRLPDNPLPAGCSGGPVVRHRRGPTSERRRAGALEEAVRMSPNKPSRAELERLTPDELIAYVETGGDWTDGAGSHPPKGDKPTVLPDVSEIPMQVTSIRLPAGMLAELDRRAGRDRDGRSGLVREAVAEWLARHPEGEAA